MNIELHTEDEVLFHTIEEYYVIKLEITTSYPEEIDITIYLKDLKDEILGWYTKNINKKIYIYYRYVFWEIDRSPRVLKGFYQNQLKLIGYRDHIYRGDISDMPVPSNPNCFVDCEEHNINDRYIIIVE